MTDNLGKQGGKAAAPTKQPEEGGTPKTGFDHAPRGDFQKFEDAKGHGGTGRGAH